MCDPNSRVPPTGNKYDDADPSYPGVGGSTSSIIGVPSWPATHPPNSWVPFLLARPSLFPATALIAASNTKGASLSAGAAIAIGLVPSTGSAPKVGKTPGGHDVIHIPIISFSTAFKAWYEAIPR